MLKVWDETNIPRFELCISPRDDIFLILTFQPGILSHQHLLNLLDTKNMIRQSPPKISSQSGDILTSWLVTFSLCLEHGIRTVAKFSVQLKSLMYVMNIEV